MLVGTELKKIKYVAVELIRKGVMKATAVECGLYMGIVRKEDNDKKEHDFLVLASSKASLRLYNMTMYDIITVDVLDEESRYMTVFTKDDADQKAAATFLRELTENLTEDKRIYANDPNKEIIDVDTYEGYPDSVLESDNITGSKASSTTKDTSSTSSSTGNYSSSSTNNTTTYTSQKPTVTTIKRKGKLPAKERMDEMKEKVLRLADGTFELKILPVPDCDREEEDEDKKTQETTNHASNSA